MIADFIGRFHPLIVHLPVGILLLAVALHLLSFSKKHQSLKPAVGISLITGTFFAVLACISGWLKANADGFSGDTLETHKWWGIGVAGTGTIYYLLYSYKANSLKKYVFVIVSGVMVVAITVAGHAGGTLTHGEGYLSFSTSADEINFQKPVIVDVMQADVYEDLVHPVLMNKCVSCHGPAKQKGSLRLDDFEHLVKGGKSGNIISASIGHGVLMERVLLPDGDKNKMPPPGRAALHKNEIKLLEWWVTNASPSNGPLNVHLKDKADLEWLRYFETHVLTNDYAQLPEDFVDPVSPQIIDSLNQADIRVIPVSASSNYVAVSIILKGDLSVNEKQLLSQLGRQVFKLTVSHTKVDEDVLRWIGSLSSLATLRLDNVSLTDDGLKMLLPLQNIHTLNIVGNPVTVNGVLQLSDWRNLKKIFLYNTAFEAITFQQLQTSFPYVVIDTGRYQLPILQGDTSILQDR